MLGAVVSLLLSGLIIGLLARFAVPGKTLRLWQTILLGIAGSLVGGLAAAALGLIDGDDTIDAGEATASFLCSLAGAIVLLILYRRSSRSARSQARTRARLIDATVPWHHLGRELRHDVLGVLADADEERRRALVQPVHADEGEPGELGEAAPVQGASVGSKTGSSIQL